MDSGSEQFSWTAGGGGDESKLFKLVGAEVSSTDGSISLLRSSSTSASALSGASTLLLEWRRLALCVRRRLDRRKLWAA